MLSEVSERYREMSIVKDAGGLVCRSRESLGKGLIEIPAAQAGTAVFIAYVDVLDSHLRVYLPLNRQKVAGRDRDSDIEKVNSSMKFHPNICAY